ncbi:Vesicular, overexpressed in cancer, prosurvival protein 1 [Plecturocebus cupreus]
MAVPLPSNPCIRDSLVLDAQGVRKAIELQGQVLGVPAHISTLLRFLLMMGVLFCCGAGFFIRRRMYPPPLIEEPTFNVSYTRQPPNPGPGQPALSCLSSLLCASSADVYKATKRSVKAPCAGAVCSTVQPQDTWGDEAAAPDLQLWDKDRMTVTSDLLS